MPDELCTVGSYSTFYEASLVQAELTAFNIPAILLDAHTIGLNWLWSNALGGIKVQVQQADLALADGLLSAELAQDSQMQPSEAVVCPFCRSGETHFFLDKRGAFLTWLIFGLPLMAGFPRYSCRTCGKKWRIRP